MGKIIIIIIKMKRMGCYMFLKKFLYSANEGKFYYKAETLSGEEKIIILNKEQHEFHEFNKQ